MPRSRLSVKHLRGKTYDVVLDTQGLIKSAVIARLAQGARCGFDRQSAREPLAALFYDKTLRVEKSLHAVVRNRLLAGRALGYSPDDPVNYGIAAPSLVLPWLPASSLRRPAARHQPRRQALARRRLGCIGRSPRRQGN